MKNDNRDTRLTLVMSKKQAQRIMDNPQAVTDLLVQHGFEIKELRWSFEEKENPALAWR